MFKITQKYTDYNGNERTDDLYFNFTEPQLRKFLMQQPEFSQENLAEIMATKDLNQMLQTLQVLFVAAYGKKSEDGRSFVKNKEIQEEFEGSAAFAQLMEDIMYKGDEKTVEEFLINIFPAKFSDSIRTELTKSQKVIPAPTA